ncbi:MAG: GTPase ObgE [Treponema sp.]|nr:GTPase ObgE [Treponema sp.]MBR4463398.1 GTPase ObgE [Treponema sp.]
MNLFADEAIIEVQSGKGGNGCIAFRREKYVPMGGPNGGDGGKGGDVIFCVRRNVKTLANIRYKRFFRAKNGGDGQGWNRYGRDGEDVTIAVPPGTTIRDAETNELIHDFATDSEDAQFTFLTGGKGGWGNVHFKTSTNQAPRRANAGQEGEYRKLRLELSIMADIGLVGFPNAGKSSLLDAFTNARPKIAPYPFTTKIPNLGVLRADDETDVIIADIPGIIEGASEGAGLGIQFLKHISRTAGLIFMIDVSEDACLGAFKTLRGELEGYSKDLLSKPHIVLCNKIDEEGALARAEKVAQEVKALEPETKVFNVSVILHDGLNDVRLAILDIMTSLEKSGADTALSGKTEKSSFLQSRSVDDTMEVQFPGQEQ